MANKADVVTVLLSCPSDCAKEKKQILKAIKDLHDDVLDRDNVVLKAVEWEGDVVPELGKRPQEIVNEQIVYDADTVIAVFSTKLGTPTGKALSGTAEEIEILRRANKPVRVYFNRGTVDVESIEPDQLARLRAFEKDIRPFGVLGKYKSRNDLVRQVKHALIETVRLLVEQRRDGSPGSSRPGAGQDAGEPKDTGEFVESFMGDLSAWEVCGWWRIGGTGDERHLIVTEAATGGIARRLLDWKNYVVEFDAMIVKANSSWIVRAADLDNYVMLQCGLDAIRPHFRVGGDWFADRWGTRLPVAIRPRTWFGVRVVVLDETISASVRVADRWHVAIPLLGTRGDLPIDRDYGNGVVVPEIVRIDMAVGSVGFRAWGDMERSHVRNIVVRKLSNQ